MRGSKCQATDLVPLRGKTLFGPRQPFRCFLFFLISDHHHCHFYMGVPPGGLTVYCFKRDFVNVWSYDESSSSWRVTAGLTNVGCPNKRA